MAIKSQGTFPKLGILSNTNGWKLLYIKTKRRIFYYEEKNYYID